MTEEQINSIWNYYLILEEDFSKTSRYVEPLEQEMTYSIEFAKLLILASTEAESVMKLLTLSISNIGAGNIADYKKYILGKYPFITEAIVEITSLRKKIKPFEDWSKGKLEWWTAYSEVKHNRNDNFKKASYKNAVYALAGLYILIFYLAEDNKIDISNYYSKYLVSEYSANLSGYKLKNLPDIEKDYPACI